MFWADEAVVVIIDELGRNDGVLEHKKKILLVQSPKTSCDSVDFLFFLKLQIVSFLQLP